MFYKASAVKIKTLTPYFFAKSFDGYIGVFNEENLDFDKTSNKKELLAYVEDQINTAWDGTIFWLNHELGQQFFKYITEWYQTHKDELSDDMVSNGVSNLILYMNTKNGIAFVDTQKDMNSVFDEILSQFQATGIELNQNNHIIYDDSHLINNLVFGRDTDINGNMSMLFLYDEGLLNEKVLFHGLLNKPPTKQYELMLIGSFFVDKKEIIEDLSFNDSSLTFVEKANKNTWILYGNGVSENKIVKLKNKGFKVSSINQAVHYFHDKYFNE